MRSERDRHVDERKAAGSSSGLERLCTSPKCVDDSETQAIIAGFAWFVHCAICLEPTCSLTTEQPIGVGAGFAGRQVCLVSVVFTLEEGLKGFVVGVVHAFEGEGVRAY